MQRNDPDSVLSKHFLKSFLALQSRKTICLLFPTNFDMLVPQARGNCSFINYPVIDRAMPFISFDAKLSVAFFPNISVSLSHLA